MTKLKVKPTEDNSKANINENEKLKVKHTDVNYERIVKNEADKRQLRHKYKLEVIN